MNEILTIVEMIARIALIAVLVALLVNTFRKG